MNDTVKEKEWVGYWWLPGQEENKIQGTLHYKFPSELWLSLARPFHKKRKYVLKGGYRSLDVSEKIMQGITSGGKFTLFNCRLLSDSPSPQYFIDYAIEGDYFDNIAKALFKKWTIRLSKYFNSWIGINGIRFDSNKEEEIGKPSIDIKYIKEPIDEFHFKLDNASQSKEIVLKINPSYDYKIKSKLYAFVENNILIELEDKNHNGINIEEFIKIIGMLSPLFEFFANNLLAPKEIYASNGSKETIPSSIYHPYSDNYVRKEYDISKIILPYTDLRTNFQSILEKYLEKKQFLSPLIDSLRFSRIADASNTGFYQHDLIFLRLVSALESYCKVFEDKNSLSTKRFNNFKKIKNIIRQALSESKIPKDDQKDILKNCSNNSMGLQKRFERLNERIGWSKLLKIDSNKMNLYIEDIVDKRNQVAHGDNRETKLSHINLWWSINVLKILICITVMKELAIDEKTVEACIKNYNREFSRARLELVKYLKYRKNEGEPQ